MMTQVFFWGSKSKNNKKTDSQTKKTKNTHPNATTRQFSNFMMNTQSITFLSISFYSFYFTINIPVINSEPIWKTTTAPQNAQFTTTTQSAIKTLKFDLAHVWDGCKSDSIFSQNGRDVECMQTSLWLLDMFNKNYRPNRCIKMPVVGSDVYRLIMHKFNENGRKLLKKIAEKAQHLAF